MIRNTPTCNNCSHLQSEHRWTTDGFCMHDGCSCGTLDTSSWEAKATPENMEYDCKNCEHRGTYHLRVDLQHCMKGFCSCNKFDPDVDKEK